MREWVEACRRLAPDHLHLHPQVDQADWVREFSQYDAGWLHDFRSANGGDLHAATWDDLNVPARMGTLAAAGVPVLQRDNSGAVVATQTLARERDLGVFWSEPADLLAALHDRERMARAAQERVVAARALHLRRPRRRAGRLLPRPHRRAPEGVRRGRRSRNVPGTTPDMFRR